MSDQSLRDALKELADERDSVSGHAASDYHIRPYELYELLAAHPVEPDVDDLAARLRVSVDAAKARRLGRPAEPAPVGHSWSPNGVHYPPTGGAHVVERRQSGCPPQPEPDPVVTDEAVQDLHERVVTEFRRHGQYTLADARAALEAAAPLLGPRTLLDREAVRSLIGAASADLAAYPDRLDFVTDAVMELARPMPTDVQIHEAIDSALDSHAYDNVPIAKITAAVLALLNGAES